MKQPTASVEPLSVLFGAAWEPLAPAEPGKEATYAAAAARDAGGSHYVMVEGDGEIMVGSIKGRPGPSTRLAGQLLASVVGASEICTLAAIDSPMENPFRGKTLLYLGRYLGEQGAAVGVLNGVPVLEFIGPFEAVLDRAHDFAGKLHSGGLLLIEEDCEDFFTPIRTAAPAAYRPVSGLPFDALWETRTSPLEPVGISRARLGLATTAFLLLAAPSAFLANRAYQQRRLERTELEHAATEKSAALAQLRDLQQQALSQASLARAADAARMAFEFARSMLDDRAGFAVSSLLLSPRESTARYTRRDRLKTFSDFVSASEEGTPAFDVAVLDAASVAFPALSWASLPTVDLDVPANGAGVLLDLGTLAQRVDTVGVKLLVTAPAAPLTQEQLSRVDGAQLATVARKAGAWQATGPADLFVGLCEALPAEACTLSDVEFLWATDPQGLPNDSFKASGRFIVGWS